MNVNRLKLFGPTVLWIMVLVFGWGGPGIGAEGHSVFVSILPQKYFVQQIGGNRVDIHVMVAPGANPATYEPRPLQMAALSKASLYFAIGVPFEKAWLNKIAAANPDMAVVHTDAGIEKRPMDRHDHGEPSYSGHGPSPAGESQGAFDPHIWTSPRLVKKQARTITEAMIRTDPEGTEIYEANFRDFALRIDQLDTDLKRIFSGKRERRFMVFHPTWGYLAQDYGLVQVPVEVEGKEPKPAQLVTLIARARAEKIRVVFVQPQFSRRSASRIAEAIGGQVIAVDPLAENWAENLRQVAGILAAAMN